ncbi:MAG: PCI domain-containing protein [Candidatus Thorarchaeota archaeon]
MAEESEKPSKKLVILSAGVELSPVMEQLLRAGLKFTVGLNTTADFALYEDVEKEKGKDKEPIVEVWYHHEIVKLAATIVPDDLTTSPLTKIFTRNIDQSRIPLSETEMFLVQWVSEMHRANQNLFDFFKALNDYARNSVEVHPLILAPDAIAVKTDGNHVPLRYFQITGLIERDAKTKPDIEHLQELLVKSQELKDKKKAKKLIEIIGADFDRTVLPEELKRAIVEADGLLLVTGDPCSMALMLLHKEITKALSKSSAQTTMVCPGRLTFREQFILELLDVKPSLLGIAEIGDGIVDNLVVGPEDASEVTDLRSKGFNVIMQDIEEIEGDKDLNSILKSVGISLKDISIKSEGGGSIGTLEDLVTQLTFKPVEKPILDSEEETKKIELPPSAAVADMQTTLEVHAQQEPENTVKLQDVNVKNYDFSDPTLALTDDMVEALMKELTGEFPPSSVVIKTGNSDEEKSEVKPLQFESQEAFTEAIQNFLKLTSFKNQEELITGIGEAIAENADMAAYAAKRLTSALEVHSNTQELVDIYLRYLKPRPLIFIKELLDLLFKDIGNPDFVSFSQRAAIVVQMRKTELKFVSELIEQMIEFQLVKSLSPKEKEHIRTVLVGITARDVTLQRRAISTFLKHYDETSMNDEVWLGLLKFDAALVALEIVEHQSKKGLHIVQDLSKRHLGSFGHVIYDVWTAYQAGDMQHVLQIAGTLSDGLLRKQQRIELAGRIKKFGSVPIETLSRSVEMDPGELEALVYEMINENELNAKIEVVEGRLTIVQVNNEEVAD